MSYRAHVGLRTRGAPQPPPARAKLPAKDLSTQDRVNPPAGQSKPLSKGRSTQDRAKPHSKKRSLKGNPKPFEGRPKPPREQPSRKQASQALQVEVSRTPPSGAPEPIRRSGLVAIVGRPNVGKSTLLNALLQEPLTIVSHTPQTTRDKLLGVVLHKDAQIGFLDTPGIHRPHSLLGKRMNAHARSALQEADVILFVTALPSEAAVPSVHPGDKTLLADLGVDKPTILLLNKIDLIRPREKMLPLLQGLSELHHFASVVPISARSNDGLDRALDEVISHLPERDALFPEDDLTDKPLKYFFAEYIREQVLQQTEKEVPHATTVTIDFADLNSTVAQISATIHVERDGQKGILIGAEGARLKAIKSLARKRIEVLLQRRARLELFVKVTDRWTQDAARLDELGLTLPQNN